MPTWSHCDRQEMVPADGCATSGPPNSFLSTLVPCGMSPASPVLGRVEVHKGSAAGDEAPSWEIPFSNED